MQNLMVVPIRGEPTLEPGKPTTMFDAHDYFEGSGLNHDYDVSPDGRRFLVVKPGEPDEAPSIVVVQNWREELERVAPRK